MMMINCKNITRYLPSMTSLILIYISLSTTITSAADTSADEMRQQSKPFYLRDIQLGDTTLPFSPVTVLVIIISFIMLTGIFNSPKSTASASHILVDDGNDAEKRLTKMRDEIKKDYNKFQVLARQHSKCPSGKAAGGRLGTFKPGKRGIVLA